MPVLPIIQTTFDLGNSSFKLHDRKRDSSHPKQIIQNANLIHNKLTYLKSVIMAIRLIEHNNSNILLDEDYTVNEHDDVFSALDSVMN